MQQLTGADAIFLSIETETLSGHTGGLVILDPREARDFSFSRIRDLLAERIPQHAPIFLRRLREVPFGLDRPYWAEDEYFDLDWHIHRAAVPAPGGDKELADLCGHLFASKLDRSRPLWEVWFIEGLAEGRVAVLMKTHHCMIDGVSGASLADLMFDLEPEPTGNEAAGSTVPPASTVPSASTVPPARADEPEVTDLELLFRGVWNLASSPLTVLEGAARVVRRGAEQWSRGKSVFSGAQRLGFNRPVGGARALAWSSISLLAAKTVARRLGVKLNDVVLYVCSQALLAHLESTGETIPEALVAMCPVSTRAEGDDSPGNQFDWMYVDCPGHAVDPASDVAEIHRRSAAEKEVARALAKIGPPEFGDAVPPALLRGASQLLAASLGALPTLPTTANMVVSNVPGPPVPLYSAGARVDAIFPISVLMFDQTLNVTVLSNVDRLDFGLWSIRT